MAEAKPTPSKLYNRAQAEKHFKKEHGADFYLTWDDTKDFDNPPFKFFWVEGNSHEVLGAKESKPPKDVEKFSDKKSKSGGYSKLTTPK